jgi:hypothetical protein
MQQKRLNSSEKAELNQMILNGIVPGDISKHFGIAISSVHNFKKQLRSKGIDFPDVKGKRPSGEVMTSGSVNEQNDNVKVASYMTKGGPNTNLIINGVSYQVSSEAKKVIINKGEIRVDF